MVEEVIKKDGSKEPFDINKIKESIEAACSDAGLNPDKKAELVEKITNKIIETLQDKTEITSLELRDKILGELDLYAPEVAASWRDYEITKGH
jgi:transcriptional regulator NrdR family protein